MALTPSRKQCWKKQAAIANTVYMTQRRRKCAASRRPNSANLICWLTTRSTFD